ncbi:hypothetical protein V5799_007079 [Amblyomma americanum]|uniref:Uncharacterized protein n=1 Tax=Amblyomma americanum TaxID=6943 RepID=A0AAQ4DUK0_AMBAM
MPASVEDYVVNSNNDILENMFREMIVSCILPLTRCILRHEEKQLVLNCFSYFIFRPSKTWSKRTDSNRC